LIDYQYGSSQYCDTFSYDAYGRPTDPLKDSINEGLFYTGEQVDSHLQQYYLLARYYDPLSARFKRMDPFVGNNQDPQSLHKYLYCHASPTNNIDPSGRGIVATVSAFFSSIWFMDF
jgi:RHS repeat-associated protein